MFSTENQKNFSEKIVTEKQIKGLSTYPQA